MSACGDRARPGPDLAPRVARDQVLELARQGRRTLHRAVDVGVASTSRRTRMPASGGRRRRRRGPARGRWLRVVGARCSSIASVTGVGALDVDQMRGALDRPQPRAEDRVGDELGVLGRRGGVVVADDHERRRADLRQPLTQVHVADRRAAGRVAPGRDHAEHRVEAGGRSPGSAGGREPARAASRRRSRAMPRASTVCGGEPRHIAGGPSRADVAQQHDPVDALGGRAGQLHRGHAAERDAGDARALDAEVVEQPAQVVGQARGSSARRRAAGDAPWPRVSYRHDAGAGAVSAGSCGSHIRMSVPSELLSTTTGVVKTGSSTRWARSVTPAAPAPRGPARA